MNVQTRWCLSADTRLTHQIDDYVDDHPHACFGHARAWREAVWKCYRLPTLQLVALKGGAVVGVAPWTVMVSPIVGPYLVIAPFASYGEVLADESATERLLLEQTARDARCLGFAYAQLRTRHRLPDLGGLDVALDARRFISPRVDIRAGAQEVWRHKLSTKTRNIVRKARRLGVVVRAVTDGWRPFLEVFASGSRSLGAPCHSARFFALLAANWGDRLSAWTAFAAGDIPAAGALCIRHRDVAHYVYGQNVHALRSTCANSLAVWQLIESACDGGASEVDLGRAELATSSERFKHQWGATDGALAEVVLLLRRRRAPDLNPTNPSLAWVRRVWSKLPEPLLRRLGPLVLRGIG